MRRSFTFIWKVIAVTILSLTVAGCKEAEPVKEDGQENLHLSVFTDGEQPSANNKIYQK